MTDLQMGDFVLLRTDRKASSLIRWGQSFRGYPKEIAKWNHCGLYVGNGKIVEALVTGVVISALTKYPEKDTLRVPVKLYGPEVVQNTLRSNATGFALSCVNEEYGWLTILAIALNKITGGKLALGVSGTMICSGLVARSLERMGFNFNPKDPNEMMPADLADYFDKMKEIG